MVVEQVRSGRPVAEVAADLELSQSTVFRWVRRDRIDRGEMAGTWRKRRSTGRWTEGPMRIRTVAQEGALQALASSRPGPRSKERDFELEAARADAARLGEALKEMAVKLMVVEGKGNWG